MLLIELFQHNITVFYTTVALAGLFVGSFLNVVIHRLPIMMERAWRAGCLELDDNAATAAMSTLPGAGAAYDSNTDIETGASADADADADAISGANEEAGSSGSTHKDDDVFNLSVPRSHCPHCSKPIRWWHNLPILSYICLRGRCAYCRTAISIRYPLIELLTLLLSLVVAWQLGPGLPCLLALLVTWYLVGMSMIDIDHQLLPDTMTLSLLWIGLLASLLPVFAPPSDAILGAALGYGILWSVYWLFRLVTGKEGMGFGDFKLLAALGALLGWQALPMIILLSSLVGAIVGLALIALAGRDRNIPIPFGPYLAAAGWIALLWGDPIGRWYANTLLAY